LAFGPVPIEMFSLHDVNNRDSVCPHLGEECALRRRIFIAAHPKLADAEIIENGAQSVDVIVVSVSEQNDVELLDAA
jgi:hypothetical protein